MGRLACNQAGSPEPLTRRRLQVGGIVQGVGFRPLVFRLAAEHQVTGFVRNESGVVTIEAEGRPDQVRRFVRDLQERTAAPARIDRLAESVLPPAGYAGFAIEESQGAGAPAPLFPPDLAVCPDCRADLARPGQRFYQYPFTSCTCCVARYSIIKSLPYDRPATAMAPFQLCDACRRAFADPGDRRFHAQTIACPDCGPRIELRDRQLRVIPGDWRQAVQDVLTAGGIAAVKGTGGFHLICDAAQREAVQRLRERKRRPRKPLALMARDLETAERHFLVTSVERELLTSPRAPILLMRPRPGLSRSLPLEALAPGQQRLGVMLPYTPLHLLLFSERLPFLVATSGNRSGLPIARSNEEALAQLSGIADLFVLHDREILLRVEDSVCQVVDGEPVLIRRSRGYVPELLPLSLPDLPGGAGGTHPVILAAGAEQKNTFCQVAERQALLSQHIGEIENEEQLACWRDGVSHLTALTGAEPQVIAYDPHPGYRISREAMERFAGKAHVPVYHHHAHMAACMAEHGLTGRVIGCILDGTGYGRDGTLWGFEILAGDYVDFDRVLHLQPVLLPGGEAAIRRPWIAAVSLLHEAAQSPARTAAWAREFFPEFEAQIPLVLAQLEGRIPCPRASSAGRLFDGVAALLGLCRLSTYEGEAATRLGELAADGCGGPEPDPGGYPVVLHGSEWLVGPLVQEVLADIRGALSPAVIARKFHHTVAEMVCQGAEAARRVTGLASVVLGGGVWQNRRLLSETRALLAGSGFQVYFPRRIPAGDGGIALGQAVSALWRCYCGVSGGTGKGP